MDGGSKGKRKVYGWRIGGNGESQNPCSANNATSGEAPNGGACGNPQEREADPRGAVKD